ncbi:MAG: AAA domain-containing protein [Pseudomonadota bacterium]
MQAKSFDMQPPQELSALAKWFAEAVRAELKALERNGGTQVYEVHSGKLIEPRGPNQGIFVFFIADGTRIPEEATGRLKSEDSEFTASVIGQQGNIIHLYIEGKTLPLGIHWARLIIDDTALLRRLAEVLEECSENSTNLSSLAISVFHPAGTSVHSQGLPNTPELGPDKIQGETRKVIERACGSSVTYIWGPPGTGKTFAIAYLITSLIEAGERVLVTSHTHAAVDQALYEAVKTEGDKCGPLATHSAVSSGKVLRVGVTADPKVPDSVLYDKVLETRGQEIQDMILETEAQIKPLFRIMEWGRAALSEWDKLAEFANRLTAIKESIEKASLNQTSAEEAIGKSKDLIRQRMDGLEKAKRAWFRREKKTRQAKQALEESELKLRQAEKTLASVIQEKKKNLQLHHNLQQAFKKQREVCEKLPKRDAVEKELSEKATDLKPLEEKLDSLQGELSRLGQVVIDEAQAIFCTLTKNYTGKELENQKFDAVIIDEISMALPPLIFLAAGRAKLRVVLAGDFLQLPPIVRSDTEIANAILGTDTFRLAGIADGMRPSEPCPVLAKLTTQRRMVPAIADVARHLVYRQAGGLDDHETVKHRKVEEAAPWLDFLPKNPLIIIDTADLYCWSGKQPGTLSRFNMYSATLAVDIAAMAAKKIQKPPLEEPKPIGIITPFAAQRRLLSKLIADMELDRWVAAGTVHTFQGNQADLIIFDSVLDEPYYTARLCNPKVTEDVLKDLNVSVTRAKNKFVFIGSSEWLNKHAKPASALGQIWSYLKDSADLLSALDLIENDFRQRVASTSSEPAAWNIPKGEKGYTIQILGEESFFGNFAMDINASENSIFALAPYFGEYRWPKIQPLFNAALAREVKITIVTPPLAETKNKIYVENVIMNLRSLGAVVVSASGLHGKDVIIDERIVYTGSMNWSSHRGRSEVIHRIDAPKYAKQCLEFLHAKHIRQAATNEDGTPRVCPYCGCPIQIVNQRRQHFRWDFQAMKVGCTNPKCKGYLRNIDERPPFKKRPVCQVDSRTKYRRVRRGRGEIWQCPKHPKECPTEKVVPGDPG